MKKLVIVTQIETIVEYHASSQSAMDRLLYIRSKQQVITSQINDVVKHIEIKEGPKVTQTQYAKVA